MRGVVLMGERTVELRDFPDPSPGPDDVVVEIRASGICGSDLRPYRGTKQKAEQPFISGHEPCGVIAGTGSAVRDWKAGDRVMMHHYAGCGQCKYCRVGYAQLCLAGHKTYGFNAHGGNAPFLLAPASTMVRLDRRLSFPAGAAVACGTGTAYTALKRLDVSGRDTLVVFGQGPVGLSATMLGAAETIDARHTDVVQAIAALTHGEGAAIA